jgi:tripartite motif-containing protein 71
VTRVWPLAAALACAAMVAAAPASADWKPVMTIGSGEGTAGGDFGSGRPTIADGGDRQFDSPGGLAVARDGTLYVADPSNHRIERFTGSGRFVASFGRHGFDSGARRRVGAIGRFNLPQGVALGPDGKVFVADNRNDRVSTWTHDGGWIRRIGRRGSTRGTMVSPWGVAVRGATLYVVDVGNRRILRFTTSGRYLGAFGKAGLSRGQLLNPYGIAIAHNGTVFVTDSSRDEVLRYSAGGRYLGSFGSTGFGPGQFDRVTGVAVDPVSPTVFVADYCGQRIERFTLGGRFIEAFGQDSLLTPTYLAFSPAGRLFVSDYTRVLAFDRTASATAQAATFRPGSSMCFDRSTSVP